MRGHKYPRTPHLPFSPGVSNEDKVLVDTCCFQGKSVVVTEKYDGECSGLTNTFCHARSLDSKDHPSRHWLKQLHAEIKCNIPEGWKVFGENLFAKHSIHYYNLPTYFFVFAILNNDTFLSWTETKDWAGLLGLQTVPELFCGIWDEEKVKNLSLQKSYYGGEGEGYVVRVANSFCISDFGVSVAKYVREGHVQTSSHWMVEKVVPNVLALRSGG